LDLSIIIPTTKERDAIFNTTLENASRAIEGIDAEVLVVNDSKDYVPNIKPGSSNITVLNNPGKGVASARNHGAQKARGKILLFLDNDIIINAQAVKHILAIHEELPIACINPDWVYPAELLQDIDKTNFGKFISRHNMISHRGWYGDGWEANKLFASKSVASFHLSLSKENFEKSGGYNTKFNYAGFEDYDFPLRLKAAGLVCYIDSRVTVFHNEADKAMNAEARLQALKMRASTRKTAVNLGFGELVLEYSAVKAKCLSVISFFSSPLIAVLNAIPNNEFFYRAYVKIYSALEASYIYKGYTE